MNASAAAHCAVLRNPFSTAVAAAKIPDGMATLSTSSRLSSSNKAESTDGEIGFVLYPGFYSGLAIRHNPAGTRVPAHPSFEKLPSRGLTLGTGTTTGSSGMDLVSDSAVPNQYRIVSQGIRLSLINNSLDNDGYFEAIRVAPSWNTRDSTLVAHAKFNAGTPTAVAAGDKVTVNISPSAFEGRMLEDITASPSQYPDWSMNPTYISGKLRDIHRHTFILHRIEDCEFQNVQQTNKLILSPSDPGATGLHGLERAAGDECFWIDRKLDTILIRCRASASASSKLVIHYHMVQHVEEMYDQNSDLARFQTMPPVAPRLTTMVINAIKRDIKPSIVRVPTAGVSITPYRRKRVYRRRVYRRR